MKYQKRVHWDRHRPEFLKVGFIFALAIAFMAFNYTSTPPEIEPFEIILLQPDVIAIPPITKHRKKVLPPPPPEKNIVVEVEPTTEPIIEFTEEEIFSETEESTDVESFDDPIIETVPIVEPVYEEETVEEEVLIFAERMPVYGECMDGDEERERLNCTHKNIAKHTYSHVRYPTLARQNQIEGTVVVSFVVNKYGNVEDVEILRDIGMGCGEEVIRAIKKLDGFLPGKQNGRPVGVRFRFPVKFSLE